MGKISDSMQNVVDEIRSSTEAQGAALEARGAALQELLDSTKQLMRDVHNTNQTQAKALKDKLSSEDKARLEATRKFVEQVGVKVSEIRSGSYNHVEQSRLERQDMSKTLKDKLFSDRRVGVETTREFMDKVHSARQTQAKAFRDKLSSDMKAGVATTREFMDKVHSARQTQANALRDKLSSDEKARTGYSTVYG